MSAERDFAAALDAAGKQVLDRVRRAADRLERHILPIYRLDSSGPPDFEGTGLLVHRQRRYYLATAAHVLRACSDGFVVPDSAGSLRVLDSHAVLARRKSDAPSSLRDPDIGFVRLTSDEASDYGHERFWDLSLVAGPPMRIGPTVFIVLGYPARDATDDPKTETVSTQTTMFMTGPADERAYHLGRVDPNTHLLIDYRRRRIATGRSVGAPPSFRGMSGGGVWPFDTLAEPGVANPPLLAGLVIEHPASYGAALLVTRATILQGFIERFDEG